MLLFSIQIITAAHCVNRAQKHYYEVHAGLLRRFSFAPEVQIGKVIKFIVNDGFDRDGMIFPLVFYQLRELLEMLSI